LIDLARDESGGLPVGSSGIGALGISGAAGLERSREVGEASDVILFHGNGLTRQTYYDRIKTIQSWNLDKPIVCNEDSPCFSRLNVALQTGTSWGYYKNHTKQDVPADWGITPGEDTFFANRMAQLIGLEVEPLLEGEEYYLQGLEPHLVQDGKRWIRLAAMHPEKVDFVEYYRNGILVDVAYDEPFYPDYVTTWIQKPMHITSDDKEFSVRVVQGDGKEITKTVRL